MIGQSKVKEFVKAKLSSEPCGGCARLSLGRNIEGSFSYLSHGEGDEGSDMIRINMACAKCGGGKDLQVNREVFA